MIFGVRMLNDPNRVCAVDKNGQFKKDAMRVTVEVSPAEWLKEMAFGIQNDNPLTQAVPLEDNLCGNNYMDSLLLAAIDQAASVEFDTVGTFFSRFRDALDPNVSLARYYSAELNTTLDANNETVCNYLENEWKECREYTLQIIQRRFKCYGQRASCPHLEEGTEEYYFDILNVKEEEANYIRTLIKTPGHFSVWPLYDGEELTAIIQRINDFSEGQLMEYLSAGDGHCVAGTASLCYIEPIDNILTLAADTRGYDSRRVKFAWKYNTQEATGTLYAIKAEYRTPLYNIRVSDANIEGDQLNISLHSDEARLLKEFSYNNKERPVAMTIDDEVLMTAYFKDEISTGQLFINGFKSEEEMRALKAILRSGPLPTTVRIFKEQGR